MDSEKLSALDQEEGWTNLPDPVPEKTRRRDYLPQEFTDGLYFFPLLFDEVEFFS